MFVNVIPDSTETNRRDKFFSDSSMKMEVHD